MVDAPRLQLDAGECPPSYMMLGSSCYRCVITDNEELSWSTGSSRARLMQSARTWS